MKIVFRLPAVPLITLALSESWRSSNVLIISQKKMQKQVLSPEKVAILTKGYVYGFFVSSLVTLLSPGEEKKGIQKATKEDTMIQLRSVVFGYGVGYY